MHIFPSGPTMEKNNVGSALAGRSVIVKLCRFVNVISNHDRVKAVTQVHGFLDSTRVGYCGRHGDWGYIMDRQEYEGGELAAEMALLRL